ncbi:MAG: glycerol-3-phosphate dehydrogenase/oxidase, partial [Pyrinomonadaceae bacterium]
LENALSARAHGAVIATYARVDNLILETGNMISVVFTDLGTGESHAAQGKIVINAAGPWIDQLLEKTAVGSSRLIGGTKGSHIIVAPFAGAPASALYVEAKTDHRPFFIIPWNGNYLIGTTDMRYAGDLDHVQIDDQEIDYLLRETNRVIPSASLTGQQILYSYAGVRPLPFTDDKDEQSITRRHFIRQNPGVRNLISVVGGKLTTYRSLAEQTVDLVFKKLQNSSPKCATAQVPLPGAAVPDFEAFCKDFKQSCGLPAATSNHLLRTYGARSSVILELVGEDSSLAEVFDIETGAIAAEVVFAFRDELAQSLSDCLLRRTMVGLNSACGLNAVDAAARVAQKHLGWHEERVKQEIGSYRNFVHRFAPKRQGREMQ